MDKKQLASLFWKLRPFYRIAVDNPHGIGVVRWDPRGKSGGRKLNFREFRHLVAVHQLHKNNLRPEPKAQLVVADRVVS